jgi:hypothetical protein
MKACTVALTVCLMASASLPLAAAASGPATGVKRALLIGIDIYEPQGTTAQHPAGCSGGRCDLPAFKNLDGPLNDVAAMRDLLSSPKFGFDPKNITVLTNPELPQTSPLPYGKLPAAQTTRDGLLAAMRKYMVDLPQSGDTVVFYYAGHGSLRINSKGNKLAMLVNGKPSHADSTLVASDAWTGNYDIRDREMTRIFNAALDKGIKLTVLLDSCHSGSFTRGVEIGQQYTERSLGYDPRDIGEAPDLLPSGDEAPSPAERKANPALIFSAAQQDQTAKERTFGDTPSTAAAHGAFTVALIKALETLPADAPADVVYRQVRATLEGEGVGDQTPALDASEIRRGQPLFGGAKSDAGKTRAAALGTDDDGKVLLDAGKLSGIDVGSEFTSITADSQGRQTRLRVESLNGITQSTAKIITPLKATVAAGQVFELTKWVPSQVDTLHLWSWPANLSAAALADAAAQIRSSGVALADDPVEQPWTDMLAWNGTAWELRHAALSVDAPVGASLTADAVQSAAGQAAQLCAGDALTADEKQALSAIRSPAIAFNSDAKTCDAFLLKQNGAWIIRRVQQASAKPLGARLTAAALKQSLPAGAKLWANLPPAQELAGGLTLHAENSLVQGVDAIADADYILAGSLSGDGPEWAWFHKAQYMAGPRAAVTHDHSPGCSTQSKYPVASDWVVLADPSSAADVASVLNGYAARLAKVNGWLNIAGDLSGASDDDYYSLTFKRVADQSTLPEGVAAKQDERFKMFLTSTESVIQKRWVYVLDIDCHGKGSLLYPADTSGNRFPNDADSPRSFELPGAPTLRIGAPYGVDTILFISTQEPLPDPYALNFEGVGTRGGSAGVSNNPLEQLLSSTSAGTRGPVAEMPTNWNIDSISLQSIPNQGH